MSRKKDEITDFYKKIPKELLKSSHNPCYKDHLLNLPFRMLLVGGSGSRKTTTLFEIISRCKNTWELIILCCKSSDEPLYQWLKSKIPSDMLHIYENGVVPKLEDYKNFKGQVLAIFDDLVNEKKSQPAITEFFIRGRKCCGGISMAYLSQSYFNTPKAIRVNCNYILLKKLSSTRDLKMILGDYNLGVDKDTLLEIYKVATEDNGTLFIDTDAPQEDRFRRNFRQILRIG